MQKTMSAAYIIPHGITEETVLSDLPAVAEGQQFWLLHEPSIATEIANIEIESLETSGEDIGVIPVGAEGELVWNRLVTDLAMLTAPPQQTAVFVVPVNLIEDSSTMTLWEFLVEKTSELRVKETFKVEPGLELVSLPEFTPRQVSIPKWLRKRCDAVSFQNVQSPPDVIAIKAGLFQIHGDLHASHEYSQDCQGKGRHVAGDYWHGIMHRREPDYGNSKYWFRRVGQHPIFTELAEHAVGVLQGSQATAAGEWQLRLTSNGWNPNVFVDLCEECAHGSDAELVVAARKIQWIEMILLLEQTYQDAVG